MSAVKTTIIIELKLTHITNEQWERQCMATIAVQGQPPRMATAIVGHEGQLIHLSDEVGADVLKDVISAGRAQVMDGVFTRVIPQARASVLETGNPAVPLTRVRTLTSDDSFDRMYGLDVHEALVAAYATDKCKGSRAGMPDFDAARARARSLIQDSSRPGAKRIDDAVNVWFGVPVEM